MSHDQVLRNVSQNRSDMNDLQNQAATQKRVTKPSDDPVAASRLLSTRIDLQGTKQYLKTLNYAQSFLNYTDQSLDDLTQNLVRLKELIIAQSNDASSNKDTRRVVATEVDQIFQQVVKIGNRKLADRFIFGGYKTTRPPFDGEGIYKGDQGEMLIGVDKQNYVAMNLPGSKVFLGEGLSRDGISHATTEQPATIEEYLQETVDKAIEEQRVSQQIQHNLQDEDLKVQDDNQEQVQNRGPASVESTLRSIIGRDPNSIERDVEVNGTNLFSLIKKVNVALRTD
ncbi:MAG: flagellar hook-associated protein FlgL, partial [Bdellovibrionales bacterium]|nr:flagellar hook-associated protein FlgL [Bdellovibrionales bacterium]